jgi:hypothetical protein
LANYGQGQWFFQEEQEVHKSLIILTHFACPEKG